MNGLGQGAPVHVTRPLARYRTSHQEVRSHQEVAGFDNWPRRVSEEVTSEQRPQEGEGAAERGPKERLRAEGPEVGKNSERVRR